ncbi:hypothetical protein [Adonisia turfae]|uniref:Uncharacterized protein n=1 Tax=Adonisia turfae CCMR0081 TaxID=2292702 RepID=A0A6M0RP26_9CYAN|nr:hypothetical protein [Adonisia turfae]NEZ57512.1 hypothetical protein [Adonisia turfae CCMR0081]
MNFSQNLAMVMVQSTEPFPVDFDNAWKWIGWKKKQDGKNVLINNFVEGEDFLRKGVKSPSGGRPKEFIVITVDCFKSLGMMAGTEKGKEIRQYFLKCEKQVKTVIPAQNEELEKLRLEVALSESRLKLASATQALSIINPALPALVFGKPEAVIEVERPVTVILDAHGRAEKYDGVTITELSKRYGFGKGKKANDACRQWISSMGINEAQWIHEPAAHITKKLPREMLLVLDQNFQGGKGQRQKLMGEWS